MLKKEEKESHRECLYTRERFQRNRKFRDLYLIPHPPLEYIPSEYTLSREREIITVNYLYACRWIDA